MTTGSDSSSAAVAGQPGAAVYLEADAGEPGEVGPPGASGTAGSQGIQGIQGIAGSQGPLGPAVFLDADSGDEGAPGTPGPTGLQGIQGIAGVGTTGAQGPMGPAAYLTDEPEYYEQWPGPTAVGPTGSQGPIGPSTGLLEEPEIHEQWPIDTPRNRVVAVTTPAVPASAAVLVNNTGTEVTVYIKGGTLTVIAVNGVATGIAAAAAANMAHTIPLQMGETIAITYSVVPTWVWIGH